MARTRKAAPAASKAAPKPTVEVVGGGIDWDFIKGLEGGYATTGYVPHADGSESGVTIGAGVDLGQRDERELVRLGLAPDLIEKLKPYLGLRKEAAEEALELAPLEVTTEEAVAITRAARDWIVRDLASRYELASGVSFESIPAEAQTVMASVAFQYGSNLGLPADKGGCPRFWRRCCQREWVKVVAELRAFGDAYKTRRRTEAALLSGALS